MGINCNKLFGKYRSIFDKIKKDEEAEKAKARRDAAKEAKDEK